VKLKVNKNEIAYEPFTKMDTTMKTSSSSDKTRMNKMKIVVIGGTGLIGAKLVKNLQQQGHAVVPASPSSGVNTITGEGLAKAVSGAEVVVDVANSPSWEDKAVLEFFETSGRNLLAAEKAAGVKHHVALSVVGTDRLLASGYFRAKMAQEKLIKASQIPYTIVRATQFFEFVSGIAQHATEGATVRIPSAMMQPIVSDDVAAALTDVALGEPLNGMVEIAGPEQIRQDELVRQFLSATGDARKVVTDDHAPYYGLEVNDQSLVPGRNARLGSMRFAEWLSRTIPQKKPAPGSNRSGQVAKVVALLLCGIVFAPLSLRDAAADDSSAIPSKVTLVFDHALPNVPGKSMKGVLVEYPPGGSSPAHTHPNSAFIYATVLEGAVRSSVNGAPVRVYHAGDNFYEEPGAHHGVSANASKTEPARLLAVFVVDSDEKNLTTPDK
jgi:uncharacterized protein YbjT (DUF2867 family)/quercetin dioxygenase-like cupin family protein